MDKTCANCEIRSKAKKAGDKHEPVPFWVFEEVEARNALEKKKLLDIIKWLIAFTTLIIILGAGVIIYQTLDKNQYEEVTETEEIIIEAQQDGEGVNIVGVGDVNYGAESQDN